jgi:hypothetical protein
MQSKGITRVEIPIKNPATYFVTGKELPGSIYHPIEGAVSATGVDSAAARSRGKL